MPVVGNSVDDVRGPVPELVEDENVCPRVMRAHVLILFHPLVFQGLPHSHSPDYERMAVEDFGYDGRGAGWIAEAYINGESDGYPSCMTDEQREASLDCSLLSRLLSTLQKLSPPTWTPIVPLLPTVSMGYLLLDWKLLAGGGFFDTVHGGA